MAGMVSFLRIEKRIGGETGHDGLEFALEDENSGS